MDIFSTTLIVKAIILAAAAIATLTMGNRFGRSFRSPFCFLALLVLFFVSAFALVIGAEHSPQATYSLLVGFGAVTGMGGLILKNV